ncbi:LuxR family two component transcriptional regulator [Plasticicumulans lactativorans]|uniref:LuxR family two component transcriptional regulator n=1 Tax=Plasticicumulans lactativorans TaxID=1133106 RepID=A0A4R2L9C1_9GAMM|nr:response regulator transcription factor [Plasticicumulans lactativorans]TCO80849.1 LuxR family two component transcriptional regulator [Plasticicumulans lactativorans]
MTTASIVHVVDDDPALRDSLKWLLESVGLTAHVHANAQEFLAGWQDPGVPACLLLDVRMPGMGGLQAQSRLPSFGVAIPVIIITGHGDVPMAVSAMKAGAVDFIEKPFNDQLLLDCVHNALARDRARREALDHAHVLAERYASLTPREREVMALVVRGEPNKDIAEALAVSRKTVEVHRAKVMDKMQAESLSDLIRMAMSVGLLDVREPHA